MSFRLSKEPEFYINRILVYSYIIKWLRTNQNEYNFIPTIEHAIRNNIAQLSQAGIKIVNKKVLTDTIRVTFRKEEKLFTKEFLKHNLMHEALLFETDKKLQEFIRLGGI